MAEPQAGQSATLTPALLQQCKSQIAEIVSRADKISVEAGTVRITPQEWQVFMTGLQKLQTTFAGGVTGETPYSGR